MAPKVVNRATKAGGEIISATSNIANDIDADTIRSVVKEISDDLPALAFSKIISLSSSVS